MSSVLVNNFKIFYYFGLSPFYDQVQPYSFIKWVVLVGLFHNVIPQAIYLNFKTNGLSDLAFAFGEWIFTLRTFAMFLMMIWRLERLRALTVTLMHFVESKQKEQEDDKNENFSRATRPMRWFPQFYFFGAGFMVVRSCLFPAIIQTYTFFTGYATEKTFVLPSHTDFLSLSQISVGYQICFLTASVSRAMSSFVAASIDVLFAGFCLVYEALYYSLATDFTKMDSLYTEHSDLLAETETAFRTSMKRLIAHHCDTIDLLSEFNAIMRPIVLLQYYTTMILLAVVLFLASNVQLISFSFIFFLAMFLVTTAELFVYCGSSSKIVKGSQHFFAELNSGHWYNYPMWAKKYMVSVLMMAGRDVTMKITESFTCDMATVSNVLQAGYSGFSNKCILKNLSLSAHCVQHCSIKGDGLVAIRSTHCTSQRRWNQSGLQSGIADNLIMENVTDCCQKIK